MYEKDLIYRGYQLVNNILKAILQSKKSLKKNPDAIREIQSRYPNKKIEIWFQDEARVSQHGTLTRCWARTGSRPRALRDFRFESAYIFGAICPARKKRSA